MSGTFSSTTFCSLAITVWTGVVQALPAPAELTGNVLLGNGVWAPVSSVVIRVSGVTCKTISDEEFIGALLVNVGKGILKLDTFRFEDEPDVVVTTVWLTDAPDTPIVGAGAGVWRVL